MDNKDTMEHEQKTEYQPKKKFTVRHAGLALLTAGTTLLGGHLIKNSLRNASLEALNVEPKVLELDELPSTPWASLETPQSPTIPAINQQVGSTQEAPEKSPTPTKPSPVRATETATPTETSTSTPEPPFVFESLDFSNNSPFTMTLKINGKDMNVSAKPIVYRDDFNEEERAAFLQEFAVGNGTAGVDVDKFGNTILYTHSGYSDKLDAAEAESVREVIEGGNIDNLGRKNTIEESLTTLNSLVGQTVPIIQNGQTVHFEVKAVAFLPHEREGEDGNIVYPKQDYDYNTKDVLDILIRETGGESSDFTFFRTHRGIFVTFCGWSESASETGWYEWTRYIIALTPKN